MKILFTKQGFEKLKNDYESLTKSRPLAVLDLKKAREMGDLSENGYYKSARFKLNDIDRNLRNFNYLIKFAVIADEPKKGIIGIGSKVDLKISGKDKKYLIVGEHEATPSEGNISFLSPIGKELLGKKATDKINVNSPSGEMKVKIIKVNP